MKPDVIQVEQQEQSQQELLLRIRQADSQTKWQTGEWISALKQRYNLTDEQIAQQTDLSRETVNQRRLVWETFADCKAIYNHLSWTHYYVALSWDDAPECLQWADELQASVSEMKAWRRSQHGADLTAPDADDEDFYASLGDRHPPGYDSQGTTVVEHNLCEGEEGDDEPGVPARAKQEPVSPTRKEERQSEVESRPSASLSASARSPEQRLDAAIEECVNVHAAILATRKLSRAVLESADREQLSEFADELQSQLNIIRGHLRGMH